MIKDSRKQVKRLVLTILIVSLWTGFSIGSGTDVRVHLDVIGNGVTIPPEGTNLFYQGDVVGFSATPQDGWFFNRWINGEGDDLNDPGAAITFLSINTLADITLTAVFTSVIDSTPIPEIILPYGDETIAQGDSVNFQGTATDGNPPYAYLWDFDGGTANSNVEDPGSQFFNTPGVYEVTLTAFDDDGDSGAVGVTITVTGNDDGDGDGGGGGGCFIDALCRHWDT